MKIENDEFGNVRCQINNTKSICISKSRYSDAITIHITHIVPYEQKGGKYEHTDSYSFNEETFSSIIKAGNTFLELKQSEK